MNLTDGQCVYIMAQIEFLRTERAGMEAENQHSMNTRGSISYGEEAFHALIEKYEGALGHNAIMTMARQ